MAAAAGKLGLRVGKEPAIVWESGKIKATPRAPRQRNPCDDTVKVALERLAENKRLLGWEFRLLSIYGN